MSFENLMTALSRWMVATEAMAAVSAELTLARDAESGDPEVGRALRAVSAAGGLAGLDQFAPPQREMVIAVIRMCLRQAQDLADDPGRAPGWTFTDPDILAGWGRGSAMVPGALAAGLPELAGMRSFLDVGTGVGLLAIAAARTWPTTSVTGIDVWDPALRLAEANIQNAGLADRIIVRRQDVTEVDEASSYDCVWFPTFFVTEAVLQTAVPRLFRSLRHGGWLVLGRMAPPPDPLAEAVTTLRTIRSGGADFDAKHLESALADAGCATVRPLPRNGHAPLEYIVGQRG